VDSLKIIQFDNLKSHSYLAHAFSTRIGGFSHHPYQSMNLGLTCGDDPQIVQNNRDKYFNYLDIPQDLLVFPVQIHSDNIQIVNTPGIVNDCDALITQTTDLFLTIQTADCFPVFVFDPLTMTIAIIHSGWKSSAVNIAGKTIQKMKTEFGVDPSEVIAGIGPGVQTQNFQVDEPVYKQFKSKYFTPDGPGHYKMDLQQVIFDQLIATGLSKYNIERNSDCTYEKHELYYSYRRDGQNSGRMMGVIGLRSK
jgi:hypothetical protein